MAPTQAWFGAVTANWRSSRFSATRAESVVFGRNRRFGVPWSPCSRISRATRFWPTR